MTETSRQCLWPRKLVSCQVCHVGSLPLQQSSLLLHQAGHPQADAAMVPLSHHPPFTEQMLLPQLITRLLHPNHSPCLICRCSSLLWDLATLKCFPAVPICWCKHRGLGNQQAIQVKVASLHAEKALVQHGQLVACAFP